MLKDDTTKRIIATLADRLTKRKGRTTVIVGAGASVGVAESTQSLKDSLLNDSGVDKEIFDTHARIHFGVNAAEKCTMEQLFSIYAKVKYTDEKAVSDFLEKHKIPAKTSDLLPPLGCELLAHLIQHGLIASVISLNFDELLEISLDDEIGEGEYIWIKSLSEFDAFSEREKEKWYEKPNLFKAHGTISRPLTLRPTVETVQRFEETKAKVLKRILDENAMLIIIGYSCSDQDFRDVLFSSIRERGSNQPDIYWIDQDPDFRIKNKTFGEIKTYYGEHGILKDPVPVTMSSNHFFEDLSHYVHEKDTMIHDVSRHVIREMILGTSPSQHDRFSIREKKFLLETLIYAARAKGLFGLNAMMQCRRMSNCCRRLAETNGKIWELFHELTRRRILFRHSIESQIYYLEEKEEELESLVDKLLRFFGVEQTAQITDELTKQLKALIEEFDIDIGPPDPQLLLEFRAPRFIRTHRELQEQTQRLIKEALNIMWISAHTGEWLLREKTRDNLKHFIEKRGVIELILCKKTIEPVNMHVQRAKRIRDQLLSAEEYGIGRTEGEENVRLRYVRWHENTFHVTISDKGEAIYFARVAKSPTIVPILINQHDDFEKLKRMYGRLKELSDESPE